MLGPTYSQLSEFPDKLLPKRGRTSRINEINDVERGREDILSADFTFGAPALS